MHVVNYAVYNTKTRRDGFLVSVSQYLVDLEGHLSGVPQCVSWPSVDPVTNSIEALWLS